MTTLQKIYSIEHEMKTIVQLPTLEKIRGGAISIGKLEAPSYNNKLSRPRHTNLRSAYESFLHQNTSLCIRKCISIERRNYGMTLMSNKTAARLRKFKWKVERMKSWGIGQCIHQYQKLVSCEYLIYTYLYYMHYVLFYYFW